MADFDATEHTATYHRFMRLFWRATVVIAVLVAGIVTLISV